VLARWSPWAPADTVRWLVAALVGHGAWLTGWWGASREPGLENQFPWAALSVAGFIVAVTGDVNWVLRARGRIVRRRSARWPEDSWEAALAGATPLATRRVVVAGPGTRHYHGPDCQFVAGKGWPEISVESAEADGRRPCGACLRATPPDAGDGL
jgi:hypothetical protein